ncbi:MAG: G5 domain-containing protein, partial [Fimbriimonadaceae bacterium]
MRDCAKTAWAVGLSLTIGMIGMAAPSAPQPKTETRVERKEIPYEVRYEFSRAVGAGRLVKVQDGKPGELVREYRIVRRDDGAVEKKLVRERRVEPIPAVYHMGRAGYVASRGAFHRGRVLEMEATAYDPSPRTIGPRAT